MLKKLMVTTAVTGLMIGAAAAQSSPPSSSQMPSAQDKPATTAPTNAAPASNAQFINSQGADQLLSSNFIGTDVVGADDAKIGDVNDILFDKDGKVVGYVVGVGGFLGIGAKNVALAPTSFQVAPAAASTTGSARSDDMKLKLNMTKDQLQQAASFESKRDQDSKARASSSGSSNTGSRPGGAAPK